MKTFFTSLAIIFSRLFLEASVQISVTQDKPPYLYVKSYTLADSGFANNGWTNYWADADNTGTNFSDDNLTFYGSINFTNQKGGSLSWNAIDNNHGHSISLLWDTVGTITAWDTASLFCQSNAAGTLTEIFHGVAYPSDFTNIYPYEIFPLWEHADFVKPFEGAYYENGPGYNKMLEQRTAQAVIKLKTGGKSTSRLRNLIGLTAYATQMYPTDSEWYASPWAGGYEYMQSIVLTSYAPTNVLPQNIALGSYGTLGTNGIKYLILPDNADVDVTPSVAGMDYYSFNVGQPQKYHSYFEVFVNQPHPGAVFYTLETAGHAFWQFKTDAPADALQYLDTSLTAFVNHSWGFYPNGAWCGLPGQLGNDDSHGYSVKRVFYIGFPDLISGLQFTRGVKTSPPEYCLAIDGYSCVGAAVDAGRNAGIWLPDWEWTPQNFGVEILLKYQSASVLSDDTPRYSLY